jgi:trimeric autotransporter adhesin
VTGSNNTAIGYEALHGYTSGSSNTAIGYQALLRNTKGDGNIALGRDAGRNLTSGDRNIDIGNLGVAGEAKTIRIGRTRTQTNAYMAGITGVTVPGAVGVIIDSSGHLGTTTSSARFKDEIKPMGKASETLFSLKPVSFRYKKEIDPAGTAQLGLVAEDVEEVNPDLVARDEQGKPYTVRYEAVNAMLLNEFLNEHRKVEQQAATLSAVKSAAANSDAKITRLESSIGEQQKQIVFLTESLKQQAAEVRKVGALLETQRSTPRLVLGR